MAQVQTVDEAMIARTRDWLLRQQNADGSWEAATGPRMAPAQGERRFAPLRALAGQCAAREPIVAVFPEGVPCAVLPEPKLANAHHGTTGGGCTARGTVAVGGSSALGASTR